MQDCKLILNDASGLYINISKKNLTNKLRCPFIEMKSFGESIFYHKYRNCVSLNMINL